LTIFRYGAMLSRYVAKVLGIEYELRRGELLSHENGAGVVIANHQSFFDVLGKNRDGNVFWRCWRSIMLRSLSLWVSSKQTAESWLVLLLEIVVVHYFQKSGINLSRCWEFLWDEKKLAGCRMDVSQRMQGICFISDISSSQNPSVDPDGEPFAKNLVQTYWSFTSVSPLSFRFRGKECFWGG